MPGKTPNYQKRLTNNRSDTFHFLILVLHPGSRNSTLCTYERDQIGQRRWRSSQANSITLSTDAPTDHKVNQMMSYVLYQHATNIAQITSMQKKSTQKHGIPASTTLNVDHPLSKSSHILPRALRFPTSQIYLYISKNFIQILIYRGSPWSWWMCLCSLTNDSWLIFYIPKKIKIPVSMPKIFFPLCIKNRWKFRASPFAFKKTFWDRISGFILILVYENRSNSKGWKEALYIPQQT